MMELYNTTNRVRRVPKYRYNGEYILNPNSCVEIEEYAAEFFKPWERVGVVVRVRTQNSENIEKVIEKVKVEDKVKETIEGEESDNNEKYLSNENEIEEITDDENYIENIREDNVSTVSMNNDEDINKVKYTREYLSELSLKRLKDIAESLDIELEDARKKNAIIESILRKVE